MASYSMNIEERTSPQKPVSIQYDDDQVSVIRREFVTLTGDHFSAVVLNQLLYWTLRVKDFDLYLEEERTQGEDPGSFQHGWIYKTAIELNEETMLGITHPTMRKYLKLLIDQGWRNGTNILPAANQAANAFYKGNCLRDLILDDIQQITSHYKFPKIILSFIKKVQFYYEPLAKY